MSKELEAFKKIVQEANECGMWHCASEISIVEQALTPPTAEEVCKALSEYLKETHPELWNKKVFRDSDGFYYKDNEEYEIELVSYRQQNGLFCLYYLPPHIVEMIARFYKENSI